MQDEVASKIEAIAVRVAASEGMEVVEVAVKGGGASRLVRISIDKPEGVTHGDCETVSQQVGTILDVEDVVPGGRYTLEVSSPGVERKLAKPGDFVRFQGKKIKVETKTAAELQSLDAGSWFDRKYAGTRIPLLAEALDTIQAGSVTLIERKAGAPADCLKLLREKRLINEVIVQSFDWEYLRAFHEQEPEQVLGALGPPERLAGGENAPKTPKELTAAWLDELQKTGAQVAVWSDKVSAGAVRLAHQRGLKVWVYTINDPDLANSLLDMGVDGLITNNTSLIWRTIALRARKAP